MKILEKAFNEYLEGKFGSSLSPEQVEQIRTVFYDGAACAVTTIVNSDDQSGTGNALVQGFKDDGRMRAVPQRSRI